MSVGSKFSSYDLWDVIVTILTPILPTYKEYVVQAPLPFALIVQHGAAYDHFTRSSNQQTCVVAEGSFEVNIYGDTLHSTRQLATLVRAKLDLFASPIDYADGRLMAMQPSGAIFMPEIITGPESPTVFHSRVTVDYAEQRTISFY